jgi:hypothetical protein
MKFCAIDVQHLELQLCIFPSHYRKFLEEELEDTKGVIRIRTSKNRQYNGQKKKYKRTNNDLQNKRIKLKIE